MLLKSFGISDIGLNRINNEDVWAALPEIGFFALADGMGGHLGGEIAANEAIEFLLASAKEIKNSSCINWAIEICCAIEKVNKWIYHMGCKSKSLCGMGTTLCCLVWTQSGIVYAHIGDSRIYRLRNKKLKLLTEDHSLFAKWLAINKIEECKTRFPYKNVLTRALGTGMRVKPEVVIDYSSHVGDTYVLCTDGLHDVLNLKEIEIVLNRSDTLEIASKNLVEIAKYKGSSDNITLLIIQSEQKTSVEVTTK